MKSSISHLEAIGAALSGFTLWVLADTSIKLAGRSRLPAYEMVAFLGLFVVLFFAVFGVCRGQMRELWPKQAKRQFLRSCLDMGNNLCVVIALRHLPLTMFYILVFLAPIVSAILAAIFLQERLEWHKSSAIVAGFVGVIIAVNPLGAARQGDWIGYTAALSAVACFSSNMVWSRVIAQSESSQSLTFFSGLVMACFGLTAMLWRAAPVNLRLLEVLFAMSLFCALGNVCFFIALKHTTTATVSQYHYTQLITGALIGYFLFHERPTISMCIGGVLIAASALYMASRAHANTLPVILP